MSSNYDMSLSEKDFQNRIYNETEIRDNICEILNIDSSQCRFYREVEFINGITSDFIICDNNYEMKAIIECKRADIGVTEYVRGVGQLFQYEYFQEEKIQPKKITQIKYTSVNNENILIIPSGFIKNTSLNIGRFKYPKNSRILEVHDSNNVVREITKNELKRISESENKNIITICQYYVRDNRLFECFILIKVLYFLECVGLKNFNRKEIENEFLRKIMVINNRNWRNAFITLSSLGIIDNNKIKKQALIYTNVSIEIFINSIYEEYIFFFIDEIMEILVENSYKMIVNLNNAQISCLLRKKYNNKDILYLTDSSERYISSWLNIMKDDFGCIDFEAKSSLREIKYIPKELNSSIRVQKIKKYSKAKNYTDSLGKKLKNILKEYEGNLL